MIAEWMLYCALCAVALSIAAIVAERTMLAGRQPVRHVWLIALVLSLAIPALAFRNGVTAKINAASTEQVATNHQEAASINAPSAPSRNEEANVESGALARASSDVASALHLDRNTFAHWDRPLVLAWLALSAALALYFFVGFAALAIMRKAWKKHVVLGVPVFVSQETGPALVGAVSPAIVLPEWALGMEPQQLELMLRHEQEHRRARDSQLLTLAQFALIVMPWNAILWWQLRRMRVAVELDCDARVLRNTDARSYGDLLLEVVSPRRRLRLIGATAFAERATQLERRILVMARRRERASRGARAVGAFIACIAIAGAWVAPHPRPLASSALRLTRAAKLSSANINAFKRYGTAGVINPMLMMLAQSDALELTGPQADSIATMNRWYRVHLDSIWRPIGKKFAVNPSASEVDALSDTYRDAPLQSMDLLIEVAPRINALLTNDQRTKLPDRIARYLNPSNLSAIGNGTTDAPDGVFLSPTAGGGRGGRQGGGARIGGGGGGDANSATGNAGRGRSGG